METLKKTRGWPPSRRAAQSLRARAQQLWRHSTGPRTVAGKAICRRNALKHGRNSQTMRYVKAVLRRHRAFLRHVRSSLSNPVIARSTSDEAIQKTYQTALDCFASRLAMTALNCQIVL